MTTKNEIINDIYKLYDVEEIVKMNLHQSIPDQSYKDLAQHIYLILYELPFANLYMLYKHKRIPHYITGIVKNQRQSPYLQYQKQFRFQSYELDYDIKDEEYIEPNTTAEDKLDVINNVLYKTYPIANLSAFTQQESVEFFTIEIYKLYIKKKVAGYSFTQLSKDLGINRSLISDSVQDCKDIIRREYEKKNKKK